MAVTSNANGIIFADNSYQTTAAVSATIPTSGVSVFSANGSFTVPAAVTSIRIRIFGGGAGSYADSSNFVPNPGIAGGSGGAGYINLSVTPGQVYNIVVGAGGNGGGATTAASNGTNTTVTLSGGSVVATATGGKYDSTIGTVSTTGTILAQITTTGLNYLLGGGSNGGTTSAGGGGAGMSGGGGASESGSAGFSLYGSPGTAGGGSYYGVAGSGGGVRGGVSSAGYYNNDESGAYPVTAGGAGGTGGVVIEW